MLWYEIISEEERKTYIKRIEFHLRNWKNYKAAVLNLERRMEKEQKNGLAVKERNAEYQIDAEKGSINFCLIQWKPLSPNWMSSSGSWWNAGIFTIGAWENARWKSATAKKRCF